MIRRKKARICLTILLFSIYLSACSSISSTQFQTGMIEASNQITSYHTTAKIEHVHEGNIVSKNETIVNTTITQTGGDGTRIDKVDGVTTNHIEVFANENKAKFRYYQENWEETLTPDATLSNVVVFPYQAMNNLVAPITHLLKWEKNIEGKWVVTYDGDRPEVSNAIATVLGIQVLEGSKSSIKMIISDKTKYIELVELKLTQNISENEKSIYKIAVTYDGMNQQKTKRLPN